MIDSGAGIAPGEPDVGQRKGGTIVGKALTNIGFLMMVAGIFSFLFSPAVAIALLILGFFTAVVGRMAT